MEIGNQWISHAGEEEAMRLQQPGSFSNFLHVQLSPPPPQVIYLFSL